MVFDKQEILLSTGKPISTGSPKAIVFDVGDIDPNYLLLLGFGPDDITTLEATSWGREGPIDITADGTLLCTLTDIVVSLIRYELSRPPYFQLSSIFSFYSTTAGWATYTNTSDGGVIVDALRLSLIFQSAAKSSINNFNISCNDSGSFKTNTEFYGIDFYNDAKDGEAQIAIRDSQFWSCPP